MQGRFPYAHNVIDPDFLGHRHTKIRHRLIAISLQLIIIAENQIHLIHRGEAFAFGLGRTTRYNDPGIRIVSLGTANLLACLTHRLIGYRASIDQNGIIEPSLGCLLLHHLGFVGVETATKGHHLDCHSAVSADCAGSFCQVKSSRLIAPTYSSSVAPDIRIWSSTSRHSMIKSPPGKCTSTLRSVRRLR